MDEKIEIEKIDEEIKSRGREKRKKCIGRNGMLKFEEMEGIEREVMKRNRKSIIIEKKEIMKKNIRMNESIKEKKSS